AGADRAGVDQVVEERGVAAAADDDLGAWGVGDIAEDVACAEAQGDAALVGQAIVEPEHPVARVDQAGGGGVGDRAVELEFALEHAGVGVHPRAARPQVVACLNAYVTRDAVGQCADDLAGPGDGAAVGQGVCSEYSAVEGHDAAGSDDGAPGDVQGAVLREPD